MPAEMRQVYSTSVNEIGYDPESRELHVVWLRGRTSAYSNVPPDVAHEVMNSWSVGEAVAQMVRDRYPHRYTGG